MKKAIPFIKIICFAVVFVLLLVSVSEIFEMKSVTGSWDYKNKVNGFYNLENDSVDLIGFGSSHMYCSLNTETAAENGYSAYVLATQQQPIEVSYYYMKEAFKTQSPKYAVYEGFMLGYENRDYSDAVLFDAITVMHFSLDKYRMIWEATRGKSGDRTQFFFPIIKYHSRFNSLTEMDFVYEESDAFDVNRGFVKLEKAVAQNKSDAPEECDIISPTENDIRYLNKMVELCKENSCRFVLMYAPYSSETEPERYWRYLGIRQYCEENGILFFDGLVYEEEMGLDYSTDFYDEGHFNVCGAEKFTSVFCKFLREN